MVAYAFLFLFVTAVVLLIVRSHYRWTYFFASALFVFLAGGMLMLTAQWQRALNFASVWFVVLILFHRLKIHYYKQPLLISDFLLIADWRNWETLFHYKEAVIGMAGLLALAAYAVFGWSGADSLGVPWRWAGAVLFAAAFVSMRHFSKSGCGKDVAGLAAGRRARCVFEPADVLSGGVFPSTRVRGRWRGVCQTDAV